MKTGRRSGVRGVWPVVQRELREGSRRPFNHWLRVGAAFAGLVLVCVDLETLYRRTPITSVGYVLFAALRQMLLLLIFCIVPTMTADCIAREKREGTLGLLFLTGLTPLGIVLGKGAVQMLRALTLLMAILPVLTIPFLAGGITWYIAVSAAVVAFSSMLICLASGLLVSSFVKSRALAVGLSLVTAFALLWVATLLTSSNLLPTAYLLGPRYFNGPIRSGNPWMGYNALVGRRVTYSNGRTTYTVIGRGPPIGTMSRLQIAVLSAEPVAASALIFALVLIIAARRVEASWKDKIPSPRKLGMIKRYCTPLYREWFANRMRRALDKNPIVWLQQYSWKVRMSKWGLCLFFVLLESFLVQGVTLDEARAVQSILLGFLAVMYTYVGVNSFLEEKKTGALELILVSPLRVNEIIIGRVWGLWKQFFLPALIVGAGYFASVMMSFSIYRTSWSHYTWGYYSQSYDTFSPPMVAVAGYLALPVFATYFALRVRNLIVGAVLTWVAMLLAPFGGILFVENIYAMFRTPDHQLAIIPGAFLGNAVFALVVCFLLRHSLSRRIYSF